MELVRGLHNLRERHRGCVLAIGNFDGFHRGHQQLLARFLEHAQRSGLPAAVMVFEPTPREFFGKSQGPGRILTLRDKLAQCEAAGVQRMICARFGRALAAVPAERFVAEVLVGRLAVKAVMVGDDFRFGAGRGGDLALLQRLGAQHGFVAEGMGTVEAEGRRVSSTAVREALAQPDLEAVAKLLGRPYRITGRVRRGLQLGRKLHMPTANLSFRRQPALAQGVYAVRARVDGGVALPGVASLGVRPTLGAELTGARCLLETHLFDAPGDLYGRVLEVEPVQYLRPERRFDSLEALAAQMQLDLKNAEEIFRTRKS